MGEIHELFPFWPFLWFGLPGRLLIFDVENHRSSQKTKGIRRKLQIVRGRHGGVEKGGGWKTSRMTPLPKRGFGPPLVRYVFHPPHVSVLCFSCTEIHDRADQKLFWRGPKIFGRARSLVRFPPPIRFAPPHITAQDWRLSAKGCLLSTALKAIPKC